MKKASIHKGASARYNLFLYSYSEYCLAVLTTPKQMNNSISVGKNRIELSDCRIQSTVSMNLLYHEKNDENICYHVPRERERDEKRLNYKHTAA